MSAPKPATPHEAHSGPNRAQRRALEKARRRHLITIEEAGEYLGVTGRTVRQMITDGRLRAYQLRAPGRRSGHFVRLDLNEIDEALKPIGGYARPRQHVAGEINEASEPIGGAVDEA